VSASPATPLLAIRSLRAAYGKIEALKGVDIDINAGEGCASPSRPRGAASSRA
jgi:hypothetical protein